MHTKRAQLSDIAQAMINGQGRVVLTRRDAFFFFCCWTIDAASVDCANRSRFFFVFHAMLFIQGTIYGIRKRTSASRCRVDCYFYIDDRFGGVINEWAYEQASSSRSTKLGRCMKRIRDNHDSVDRRFIVISAMWNEC